AMARTRSTSKRDRVGRGDRLVLPIHGGVETNRTELLPGPPQVLGQGTGTKDAEHDPKTSTPPLTAPRKKSTVRAPQGEPPQAAYLMSLFGWLTQPGLRARVR